MDLRGSDAAGPASSSPEGKEMQNEEAVELRAPDESMSDQGEASLVGPDGAARTEGDGEGEDLTPATLKRKNDGFLKKVFVSAALALLLATTGWMAYKRVSAPSPEPLLPGVPKEGIDGHIKLYSKKKLFEVRDSLDEAWTAASDNVKMTFVRNYMPSSESGHVPVSKALSYFKLHILEMLDLGAPSSDEEIYVKRQHYHKLLFVYSMVDAAVQRLVGLRHMEEDTKLPAMILNYKPRRAQDPQGTVAVGLFIDKLSERGIEYTPTVNLGPEAAVPLSKVNEFLDLLEMEERLVRLDKKVHEAFEVLLEGYGESLETLQTADFSQIDDVKLPRDETTVDTHLLFKFLHARYIDRASQDYRNQLLDAVVEGWSEQKVDEAIGAFREHHRKHLENQLRQKRQILEKARETPPAIPLTHGFPVAMFLM